MIVQLPVNVEQATYNVGMQLAKFVGDVKKAMASGSVPAEVAAIAVAAISDLLPVLSQVPALKQELSENPQALINTVLLVGEAVVQAIVS